MPNSSNLPAMKVFLARLLAHSVLSEKEQEQIAALPASRVEVPAHRDFVRVGETVEHVTLVERGLVGRFGQTQEGKRQFVSLHIPGEMTDLHSLMMPEADASLNSHIRSTVLRVPHKALRELGDRYPAIATAISRDCILHAEIVSQWLVNIGRRDARARVSHLLCEMALRHGQPGPAPKLRYELPMTQEQLGDALALTSVHVNRTLGSLRDDGLVAVGRGVVDIQDWDALAAVGEFDPTYLHLDNGQH